MPGFDLAASGASGQRILRVALPKGGCTKIEKGQSQDRNWPVSWVGDTGIEPLTSSV